MWNAASPTIPMAATAATATTTVRNECCDIAGTKNTAGQDTNGLPGQTPGSQSSMTSRGREGNCRYRIASGAVAQHPRRRSGRQLSEAALPATRPRGCRLEPGAHAPPGRSWARTRRRRLLIR